MLISSPVEVSVPAMQSVAESDGLNVTPATAVTSHATNVLLITTDITGSYEL